MAVALIDNKEKFNSWGFFFFSPNLYVVLNQSAEQKYLKLLNPNECRFRDWSEKWGG